MPFRIIDKPPEIEEEEKPRRYRITEKPKRKPSTIERIGAKVPAEFFGQTIGAIPRIAELAAKTTPGIEQQEKEAAPSFLGQIGLEPAPEKGLRNLLTLLGHSDLVQKLTPEALSERFRETTGGKFEPQTPLERILVRGAQLAGGVKGLGATGRSSMVQALAGLAGQTGREYGLEEPLATATELAAGLGGEAFSPGLIPKAGEKKLAEFATKKGLTEKQITPLLKSKTAQEKLGGMALKTGALKKSVKEIGRKFDENFYEPLKESSDKLPKLTDAQQTEFLNSLVPIQKELRHSKLPTPDKEYAEEQLVKLAERVEKEGISPRDIIDTWQDINKNIQWKKVGSKPYAHVKDALIKTFEKVSPELAEDFKLTNQLYSKFKPLERALEPKALDNILGFGHEGEIAIALAFHNPSLIKAAFGHVGAKYIANQLLTNPRYHNFSQKMLNAVYRQDKVAIKRLSDQFEKMLDQDMNKKK